MIEDLRKKAREKYLKDRESQQMDLYKKILDDQGKLLSTSGGNLASMLLGDPNQ